MQIFRAFGGHPLCTSQTISPVFENHYSGERLNKLPRNRILILESFFQVSQTCSKTEGRQGTWHCTGWSSQQIHSPATRPHRAVVQMDFEPQPNGYRCFLGAPRHPSRIPEKIYAFFDHSFPNSSGENRLDEPLNGEDEWDENLRLIFSSLFWDRF